MQKSEFGEFLDEKVTYVFRLFIFSFSYLFAVAVIDLVLGLLPVQKFLESVIKRAIFTME